DHLDVALGLEHGPEALADDHVVFRQQDFDHRGERGRTGRGFGGFVHVRALVLSRGMKARTVVPSAGADSTVKTPPNISTRSRMLRRPRRLYRFDASTWS